MNIEENVRCRRTDCPEHGECRDCSFKNNNEPLPYGAIISINNHNFMRNSEIIRDFLLNTSTDRGTVDKVLRVLRR